MESNICCYHSESQILVMTEESYYIIYESLGDENKCVTLRLLFIDVDKTRDP